MALKLFFQGCLKMYPENNFQLPKTVTLSCLKCWPWYFPLMHKFSAWLYFFPEKSGLEVKTYRESGILWQFFNIHIYIKLFFYLYMLEEAQLRICQWCWKWQNVLQYLCHSCCQKPLRSAQLPVYPGSLCCMPMASSRLKGKYSPLYSFQLMVRKQQQCSVMSEGLTSSVKSCYWNILHIQSYYRIIWYWTQFRASNAG